MITLNDIMKLECMHNYEIIAGPTTFHQTINNIALLDYEPLEKRYDIFLENEFVITSLLFGRSDPTLIKEAILSLINRKISTIAIQKLYDFELDQETIEKINQSNTTVLLYKDTYMEEIIGSIKHLLYKDSDETKYENWINQLIQCEYNDEIALRLTQELIPNTYKKIRCHYIEPKNKKDSLITALHQLRTSLQNQSVKVYKYQNNYLIIEEVNDNKLVISTSYSHYTMSESLHYSELCYALKQVIQAMDYAKNNEFEIVKYTDMKSDVFSYAVKENWLIQHYCENQMKLIQHHDESYGTNLIETLLCYIKCHGDTKQCGNLLYQHPNTIRYRIGKIKDVLDLNELEEKEVYEYLFMLVRFKNEL